MQRQVQPARTRPNEQVETMAAGTDATGCARAKNKRCYRSGAIQQVNIICIELHCILHMNNEGINSSQWWTATCKWSLAYHAIRNCKSAMKNSYESDNLIQHPSNRPQRYGIVLWHMIPAVRYRYPTVCQSDYYHNINSIINVKMHSNIATILILSLIGTSCCSTRPS